MTDNQKPCAAKSGRRECSAPRAPGTLFCQRHQSADSRLHMDHRPITNEQLAHMMQRDGEQQ